MNHFRKAISCEITGLGVLSCDSKRMKIAGRFSRRIALWPFGQPGGRSFFTVYVNR
jgi:hypothetical protein